jgi:hypothetical protein
MLEPLHHAPSSKPGDLGNCCVKVGSPQLVASSHSTSLSSSILRGTIWFSAEDLSCLCAAAHLFKMMAGACQALKKPASLDLWSVARSRLHQPAAVRVFLELVPWGGLISWPRHGQRPTCGTDAGSADVMRRPAGLRARALLLAGTNRIRRKNQNHTATASRDHEPPVTSTAIPSSFWTPGGPPQPRLVTCGGRPDSRGPHTNRSP